MKRYIIVTKRGREVLTTSPTLIVDYKNALHSLRKSVVNQLNKLNNLHFSLNDYMSTFEPLNYDIIYASDTKYEIVCTKGLKEKRTIAIKEITIK